MSNIPAGLSSAWLSSQASTSPFGNLLWNLILTASRSSQTLGQPLIRPQATVLGFAKGSSHLPSNGLEGWTWEQPSLPPVLHSFRAFFPVRDNVFFLFLSIPFSQPVTCIFVDDFRSLSCSWLLATQFVPLKDSWCFLQRRDLGRQCPRYISGFKLTKTCTTLQDQDLICEIIPWNLGVKNYLGRVFRLLECLVFWKLLNLLMDGKCLKSEKYDFYTDF